MIEVIVPSPGESINSVTIANWLVSNGEYVEKEQEIVEIDSDKATLSIVAEESGTISIDVEAGDTVKVGAVIAHIDTTATPQKTSAPSFKEESGTDKPEGAKPKEVEDEDTDRKHGPEDKSVSGTTSRLKLTPLARVMLEDKKMTEAEVEQLIKSLLLKKSDIRMLMSQRGETAIKKVDQHPERREVMSPLRQKLAQRLVAVKNETAMLTTFNEIDMQGVMSLRKSFADAFVKKHGVKPGLVSFFAKAVSLALREYPIINAVIEDDEIVYHNYVNIGIAVSAPKGLVVPVVRNVDKLTIAEIEQEINRLAEKARNSRISLDDMKGGTFTITNGGVFGSLLSTPIINPPQSGILGMHTIKDRPVALENEIKIRPMMYVALTYDHRIVDGRESVGFLLKIKALIENPEMMVMPDDPVKLLLDLD